MKNHKTVSLSLKLLCITLICAASSFAQYAVDPVLRKQYADAVVDAKRAEAKEIVETLTQIASCNSNLVWEDKKDTDHSRMLVTTWVGTGLGDHYSKNEGQVVDIPADA